MSIASILAVGVDPAFGDATACSGFTPQMVRAYIDAQLEQVRSRGYQVESCLVRPDDSACGVVEQALRNGRFDAVLVGAGLREPKQHVPLFETIINLIREIEPTAQICFNTTPADTLLAVQRRLGVRSPQRDNRR